MKYILLLLFCQVYFAQTQDTLSVFFNLNSYKLEDLEKEKLSTYSQLNTIDSIQIIGYTDFLGSTSYNKALAQQRVNTVSKLLAIDKAKLNTIAYGEIKPNTYKRPKNGIRKHRKVDIINYYTLKDTKASTVQPINTKHAYLDSILLYRSGETLRLKHINFLLGTANLTKASIPELDQLSKLLLQHNHIEISIEGHVCCGSKKEVNSNHISYENDYLSRKRAEKIYYYLQEKGINPNRLKYKAYGFSKPLVFPEKTEEDRYQNRRIEIRVTKNNYLEALNTIPVGESIRLRHINFAWGKYALTPKSAKEIENLYVILNKYPNLGIIIEGHVCCGRKEEAMGEKTSHHNYTLSFNRALEVKKALLKKGIEDTRISVKGYGFTKPLVFPERKDDNSRAINRRIEVKLIKR